MMMRRIAAGLAAAALGASVLAGAAPAMADPGDGGFHRADERDRSYYQGYTQLSFDASPEPIRAGRTLSLSGRLSVRCDDDYIDGYVQAHQSGWCRNGSDWQRLGWKTIDIEFKSDRSNRWEYVTSTSTERDGSFYTEARAYTSGTWRAVFDGSRHLGSRSASDWVRVYGRHH